MLTNHLLRCAPEHLRRVGSGDEIPFDEIQKLIQQGQQRLESPEELEYEDLVDDQQFERPPHVDVEINIDEDDVYSVDNEFLDDEIGQHHPPGEDDEEPEPNDDDNDNNDNGTAQAGVAAKTRGHPKIPLIEPISPTTNSTVTSQTQFGYGNTQYWPPEVATLKTWWRVDKDATVLKTTLEGKGPSMDGVRYRTSLDLANNTYIEYIQPVKELDSLYQKLDKPVDLHTTLYFGDDAARKMPQPKKAEKVNDVVRRKNRSRRRWEQIMLTAARKKTDLQWKDILGRLQDDMVKAVVEELQSWIDHGACRVIRRKDVPINAQILRARVVKKMKDLMSGIEVTGQKCKARMIVLGFEDARALVDALESDAPTIGRLIKSGDVRAAFLRGDPLEQPMYAEVPDEMRTIPQLNLTKDDILVILKAGFGYIDAPQTLGRPFQ